MIIRKKQLDKMTENSLNRFIEDLEPKIREEYPEKSFEMTSRKLLDMLRKFTSEAAHYNLDTSQPVTRYIAYRFDYGSEFPTGQNWQWALQILKRKDLSEYEKINRIDSRTSGGALFESNF